ncbi:MAG TPA: ATP-binding protein, partial [Actinomycetota bacterium]|nr:ATP-binding protein [Actinomycetota bacterium]
WGFDRRLAMGKGLNVLFAGPSGTGKTMAAEVLAHEIGLDLYKIDLATVISKWIGETEKNLAAAFEAAERGGMALLFDEADALFGKRTEVGDARDRYANLETAYLLSRLERFDGLAMLASNLRQNLDSAFARRLEFIVPFDLPDTEQRVALWTRHIPPGAPLASGVRLERLAALYPLPGALIRNAAVAAAFLAAAEGSDIEPRHLVHAIEREYVKAGDAFPGPPPEDAQ